MKQESWATPYKKEDLTGKLNHAEAIVALREGKTVRRGNTTLKLDANGKANHTFTTEELHSNQWEIIDDLPVKTVLYFELDRFEDIVKEEVSDDTETGSTEETDTAEEVKKESEEEATDTTDEVPTEKPVKRTRKLRTTKAEA